ncbi:MAG: HDIG domain-containing protein [Thermotogota bacterium]|nr:HDIG domain-containing protein [Thermotogota bacterium]
MISREKAYELVKENIRQKNLIKHVLAVESVMKALARKLNQDEEKWGLAGLLHDLDYEETKNDFENHGKRTVEMLSEYDVPDDIKNAILAHCEKKDRETLMEKAIYAADPVTGFIVAAVLIRKGTTLKDLDLDFLLNRFKEKSFARGASREQMESCKDFGVTLEDFLVLSLNAMRDISEELEL